MVSGAQRHQFCILQGGQGKQLMTAGGHGEFGSQICFLERAFMLCHDLGVSAVHLIFLLHGSSLGEPEVFCRTSHGILFGEAAALLSEHLT